MRVLDEVGTKRLEVVGATPRPSRNPRVCVPKDILILRLTNPENLLDVLATYTHILRDIANMIIRFASSSATCDGDQVS